MRAIVSGIGPGGPTHLLLVGLVYWTASFMCNDTGSSYAARRQHSTQYGLQYAVQALFLLTVYQCLSATQTLLYWFVPHESHVTSVL